MLTNEIHTMQALNGARENLNDTIRHAKNLLENLDLQLARTLRNPTSTLALSDYDAMEYSRRLSLFGSTLIDASDTIIVTLPEEPRDDVAQAQRGLSE
jgi:hypothetical protein